MAYLVQATPRSTDNFDTSVMHQPIKFTPPDMSVLASCGNEDPFRGFNYINHAYAPVNDTRPKDNNSIIATC